MRIIKVLSLMPIAFGSFLSVSANEYKFDNIVGPVKLNQHIKDAWFRSRLYRRILMFPNSNILLCMQPRSKSVNPS